MNKLLAKQIASRSIITILSLIIIFHILIITGVIPYGIVWGGRLKSTSQMLQFEAVSIIMNMIMISVVAIHEGFIKLKLSRLVTKAALWAMCALFLLNTIGNLYSINEWEKMIFTPMTLILAIFSFTLAIHKENLKAV